MLVTLAEMVDKQNYCIEIHSEVFHPSVHCSSAIGDHRTVLVITKTEVVDILCASMPTFNKLMQISLVVLSVHFVVEILT